MYNKFFMKQAMMRKVLMALIPILVFSVYNFGLRVIVLTAFITGVGIITEYLFKRNTKSKVSEAVIVSGVLLSLTLPATTPLWIGGVGIIFGIVFAKEAFGGFGKNAFNPALVSRTFLYVCFPEYLTNMWTKSSEAFPGGFTTYLNPSLDSVSGATPLALESGSISYLELFLGNTSGSMGETSILLIILAGIYLIYTKSADWRLMISPIIGFLGLSTLLYFLGIDNAVNPIISLLSGSIIFLSVFFVTEPITAPKTNEGKIIYGLLIGIITVVIRSFGIFIAGGMFAVLIMNTFSSILDLFIKDLKKKKKEGAKLEKA